MNERTISAHQRVVILRRRSGSRFLSIKQAGGGLEGQMQSAEDIGAAMGLVEYGQALSIGPGVPPGRVRLVRAHPFPTALAVLAPRRILGVMEFQGGRSSLSTMSSAHR